MELKKGDLVWIKDLSYSRIVKNGKLRPPHFEYAAYGQENNKQFIVVEINCKFPKTSVWLDDNEYNDTVIQCVETNEVIFIQKRSLQPVKHKIIINDKTVEISQESFLNLKKQLL